MSSIASKVVVTKDSSVCNTANAIESPETVKELRNRFPELFCKIQPEAQNYFRTGNRTFDCLFPREGLPSGLLVELTGSASSGKTALLFNLLAGYQRLHQLAYVDCSSTFFPIAAKSAGIAVEQLLMATTNSCGEAVRAVENLLRLTPVRIIVCDVTGRIDRLQMEQMHRLRIRTVRYQGLVVFLTDLRSHMFPPSLMSLQLTVSRRNRKMVCVTITRSKISPGGQCAEVQVI